MNDGHQPHGNNPPPQPPPSRGSGIWVWLVGGAALAALIYALAQMFPNTLSSDGNQMRLVYMTMLLVLVASGIVGGRRYRFGAVVKQAAVWIAIALVLVVGYSFRHEFSDVKDRVVGEFLPHQGVEEASGAMTFRRANDRHFHVEASVDGVPIRFMVDTGASSVVLTPDDARRLGFDPARLSFTRVYNTANGTVRGAPVRLGEIRVGSISVRDVRASVNGVDMDQSLLGLSFLDRLDGYEVRRDTLTLRR